MSTEHLTLVKQSADTSLRLSKSVFYSDGVQCAASLYTAGDHEYSATNPMPAILMVHGWGGVQGALTAPFLAAFTAAGFAVMTFDYPGWGASAGLPRNCINPTRRVGNVDAALTHLKQQPGIDGHKIVLWGTSFGGGHVVDVHERVVGDDEIE